METHQPKKGAPVGHQKAIKGKPTFKNSDGCTKYPTCEECYKHQKDCTWNA